MQRRLWGGEPITHYGGDRYFFDEESLLEWIVEHDIEQPDLKLVFCTPKYPHQIDPGDYFCDDLPEDGELADDQLLAAFELLNEMIEKSPALSWSSGEEAVELPQAFIEMVARERQEAQA